MPGTNGSPGTNGTNGATGPAGLGYNPAQIALLKWGNASQSFTVGSSPEGICFDGANIWVANQFTGNVSKF